MSKWFEVSVSIWKRVLVEVDVFDGSGYLRCVFFNQGWRAKQLAVGTEAVLLVVPTSAGRVDPHEGAPVWAMAVIAVFAAQVLEMRS